MPEDSVSWCRGLKVAFYSLTGTCECRGLGPKRDFLCPSLGPQSPNDSLVRTTDSQSSRSQSFAVFGWPKECRHEDLADPVAPFDNHLIHERAEARPGV